MSSTPEQRARWRAYRAANRERLRNWARTHYATNRETILAEQAAAYPARRHLRYDTCGCGATKLKRYQMCVACRRSTPQPRKPLADRLWAKVDRSAGADACWPWTGATMKNGYGHMGIGGRGGKTVASHRIAYEVTSGSIPDGMYVLHACDNRPCCNPAHLSVGTQSENLRQMVARGRHPSQSSSAA